MCCCNNCRCWYYVDRSKSYAHRCGTIYKKTWFLSTIAAVIIASAVLFNKNRNQSGDTNESTLNDFYKNEELVYWRAANIDDDPYADVVIFGTKREYGFKISGWGHDGGKGARRHLIEELTSLLSDPKECVYIEVAGRPAEILTSTRFNVPKVPKEKVEAPGGFVLPTKKVKATRINPKKLITFPLILHVKSDLLRCI